MVISFHSKWEVRLFRTQATLSCQRRTDRTHSCKVRGRISINLIEYEAISPRYYYHPRQFADRNTRKSVPTTISKSSCPLPIFCPPLPEFHSCRKLTHETVSHCHCNEEEWAHISSCSSTLLWNILHCSPYRRGAVQHLIVSLLL